MFCTYEPERDQFTMFRASILEMPSGARRVLALNVGNL